MGLDGRNGEKPQYCDACFSGEYPIQLTDHSTDQPSPQLSFLTQLA
jgi:amidophosphoribosyltransferase